MVIVLTVVVSETVLLVIVCNCVHCSFLSSLFVCCIRCEYKGIRNIRDACKQYKTDGRGRAAVLRNSNRVALASHWSYASQTDITYSKPYIPAQRPMKKDE